ncbi:MAG: UDP-glucose 4-epimerase GalE [Burkholderiaceae bacterium]|nr:UDP-glucose 4-epimerase GalE [Burkholderiaceae bacterium]
MTILLTGGTGYIGSHTAVALMNAGHKVVLYDNLVNSNACVVDRLEKITGAKLPFVLGDIRNTDLLASTLESHGIEAVIHFAGLKAVGESVGDPLSYYDNNVGGTISVLRAMARVDIRRLVFSSSATVYGDPQYLPIDEAHRRSATNSYGRTKLQIENILEDLAASDARWRITCLRYFNPVGAHDSGLIGEDPTGVPNNLMPFLARVAAGKLPYLNIFGGDYDTLDGTGVRDYIHVMDLAEGHLAAVHVLSAGGVPFDAFNLGTGRGQSVLEMLKAFEQASGQLIPSQIVPRRAGDVSACYAKADKAAKLLGWAASRPLDDMCRSTWKFQINKGLE